jgi:hypothetical protein
MHGTRFACSALVPPPHSGDDLPNVRIDYNAYADGGPIETTRFRLRRSHGCVWLAF